VELNERLLNWLQKEKDQVNKKGEFVGEEKVNDCIKAEREKEKGREIVQEQE
jgi:hypothetical protein